MTDERQSATELEDPIRSVEPRGIHTKFETCIDFSTDEARHVAQIPSARYSPIIEHEDDDLRAQDAKLSSQISGPAQTHTQEL